MTSCQTAAWFELYRVQRSGLQNEDLLNSLVFPDHRLYLTGEQFYLVGPTNGPVLVGVRQDEHFLWWRQCDLCAKTLRDCPDIAYMFCVGRKLLVQ